MSKKDRLFRRTRKNKKGELTERGTWYADLRDLGAGRPSTGTDDRDEAVKWLALKLQRLERGAVHIGHPYQMPLEIFAELHLTEKKRHRRESTVARDRQSLDIFLKWAKPNITLGEIDPRMLRRYVAHRQDEGMAPQTILHELHALSSLFEFAIEQEYSTVNPVRQMKYKPRVERNGFVEVLEPDRAAAFLAECEGDLHTLMTIALYTGGRRAEVCGLEWKDVDFKRGLVHFRPNKWRKLKRGWERVVKLWPALRAILEAHPRSESGLVVESPYGGMYKDVRASMEAAAERAEIDFRKVDEDGEVSGGRISWNTLRHTYASLRLQTIENGAPISPFKVSKELGHSGLDMIYKHYGAVLESPQRLEVIEYI